MPLTTCHIATLTDPITGEQLELTAATAAELDQLLEDRVRDAYPLLTETPDPDVP